MTSAAGQECVLVTGASGHLGQAVIDRLRHSETRVIATDLLEQTGIIPCDLRIDAQVAALFAMTPVRAVIHLAGVLPSAFHADPLAGAAVNLTGSLNLLRHSIANHVKRFVFASSVSVYGLMGKSSRAFSESDPAAPDEPYGACKRVVETVGETLNHNRAIQFVALRLARIVGPGIRKTASPWRAQMFLSPSECKSISIPFSPCAEICLLHVEDAAHMLITLAEVSALGRCVYNSPAEIWTAQNLKELIEQSTGIRVELGHEDVYAGATCDGDRFTKEFQFRLQGLRERLAQKVRR